MDFLNAASLAHFLYDMYSRSRQKTKDYLKSKLHGWVFEDSTLEQLAEQIDQLQLKELSESAIKVRLERSEEISRLREKITSSQSIDSIIQTHNGSGDNIGGNKYIRGKSE